MEKRIPRPNLTLEVESFFWDFKGREAFAKNHLFTYEREDVVDVDVDATPQSVPFDSRKYTLKSTSTSMSVSTYGPKWMNQRSNFNKIKIRSALFYKVFHLEAKPTRPDKTTARISGGRLIFRVWEALGFHASDQVLNRAL